MSESDLKQKILDKLAKEFPDKPMSSWKNVKNYIGTNNFRFSISEVERAVDLALEEANKVPVVSLQALKEYCDNNWNPYLTKIHNDLLSWAREQAVEKRK